MSHGHPVDAAGRVLPTCDWPPDRAAPQPLELVRRFCNTANLESGADRLGDVDDFGSWLVEQGHPRFDVTSDALVACSEVREAIRAAAVAHRDDVADEPALAELSAATSAIVYTFEPAAAPLAVTVAPEGTGDVDRFLGRVVLAVVQAISDDTWRRLKACRRCRWVFYDHSKNRSGRWCSMSACGGRAKVQHHRARRRAATG